MDNRTLECKQRYEGQHYFTRNGLREFVILEYNAANDVLIEFIESKYQTRTSMCQIKSGLKDPFEHSCVYFEDNKLKYEGSYFKTNQGYIVQVLKYNSISNVDIKFLDTGYITSVTIQNLKNGQIRNPFHRNSFGGYLGIGEYNNNNYKWLYRIWYNMLIRANDPEYYSKHHEYETNVYDNTYIVTEWLNYNIFADWYVKEISKLNPNYSYDIDKDLLYPYYKEFTKNKKCYSPSTCVLIPRELNNHIIVNKFSKSFDSDEEFLEYKCKKENNLKNLAQMYYNNNAISKLVYDTLMVYELEFIDLRAPKIDSKIYDKIKKKLDKIKQ